MKKSLLTLYLTTGLTLFCNATEVPSPVRGQFYPIYNNWMDPTTSQVPLNKVNVTFACFAHVYNSTDGTIHWSVPGANGSLTPPATANNSILGYENARNGASPTTNDPEPPHPKEIRTLLQQLMQLLETKS